MAAWACGEVPISKMLCRRHHTHAIQRFLLQLDKCVNGSDVHPKPVDISIDHSKYKDDDSGRNYIGKSLFIMTDVNNKEVRESFEF